MTDIERYKIILRDLWVHRRMCQYAHECLSSRRFGEYLILRFALTQWLGYGLYKRDYDPTPKWIYVESDDLQVDDILPEIEGDIKFFITGIRWLRKYRKENFD